MKYRKKPVIIDAEPYREGLEDKWVLYFSGNYGEYEKVFNTKEECLEYSSNDKGSAEYQENFNFIYEDPVPCIITLEGRMDIKKTDYIITGVKGERYPCKKDIFEKTYEEEINVGDIITIDDGDLTFVCTKDNSDGEVIYERNRKKYGV